jgi:hypothetical protein
MPGADIAFDVLPQLIGRMHAYGISEYLLDIDTCQNYELAQRTWPGVDQAKRQGVRLDPAAFVARFTGGGFATLRQAQRRDFPRYGARDYTDLRRV